MKNKVRKSLTIFNVSKVLHEEWDPIGCGVPEDEYEAYAKVIVCLLKHNCSESLITTYLGEVSLHMIGFSPNWIKIKNTLNKFKEYKWL